MAAVIDRLATLEEHKSPISDEIKSRVLKAITHLENITVACWQIEAQGRALKQYLHKYDYFTRYQAIQNMTQDAEAHGGTSKEKPQEDREPYEESDEEENPLNETLI